jgi:hypothetical protein
MVETPLVTPDKAWGQGILDKLDDAGFPISAALWLLGEDDEWRLVIATRLYDELGQKGAYLKLIEVLKNTIVGDLPLRLESNKRPLVRALRKTFGAAKSIEWERLAWQPVGGVFIRGAYLYRVN